MTGRFFAVILGTVTGLAVAFAILASCAGTTAQQTAQAQATASASVVVLNDAWKAAADMCLAQSDRTKCGPVLSTVYGYVVAAAQAVDSWGSASQGNVDCAVSQGATALQSSLALMGVTSPPPIVVQALNLARIFTGGSCPTLDAAAPPAPAVAGLMVALVTAAPSPTHAATPAAADGGGQ